MSSGRPNDIAIDISNTLDSSRLSGLQRLAARVVADLDDRPDVRLTLLDGRSGSLRVALGGRRRLAGHFEHGPGRTAKRLETRIARRVPMGPSWTPTTGGWLVDIEPSWHGPQPRGELLPSVFAAGGSTAAVVPDLLPIRQPQWFPDQSAERFTSWLEAHRVAGSRWLAISEATAADLADWLDGADDVAVLRLGVDAAPAGPVPADGLVLMIGTVEPRKGHELILDALDALGDRAPVVDVVGSAGWAAEALVNRLDRHPRVRWHRSLDDQDLDELLRHTSLVIQPSLGEGFGLPVAEALARDIPVLASDLPVLAEAAKGAAGLVARSGWAEALARFRTDPAFVANLRAKALGFEPWSWGDTADDLLAALADPE